MHFKPFRKYVDVHVAKNLNHFEQILYLTLLKILIGLEYLNLIFWLNLDRFDSFQCFESLEVFNIL